MMNNDVRRDRILQANELATKMVSQGHRTLAIEKIFRRLGYLKESTKTWDVVTRHNFIDTAIKNIEEKRHFPNIMYWVVCGFLIFGLCLWSNNGL